MAFLLGSNNLGTTVLRKSEFVFLFADLPFNEGYNLCIYDRGEKRVALISSASDKPQIFSLQFTLDANGCQEFTLEVDNELREYFEHSNRIDVHPYFDKDPWYSGIIDDTSLKQSDGTKLVVKGSGFFDIIKGLPINRSFENKGLSEIIGTIALDDISKQSRIVYNPDMISTSVYQVNKIEFLNQAVDKALEQLATLDGNAQYGVNGKREFYWLPQDDNLHWYRFLDRQLSGGLTVQTVTKDIYNRLLIKCGKLDTENKNNYAGTIEDAVSRGRRGLKWKELTAPDVLDTGDALRWGNYELQKIKDPVQKATLEEVELWPDRRFPPEKIEARGKIRVYDHDGVKYDLPVAKVQYKITGGQTISVRLEIGSPQPSLEQIAKDFYLKIARDTALNEQNLKQI